MGNVNSKLTLIVSIAASTVFSVGGYLSFAPVPAIAQSVQSQPADADGLFQEGLDRSNAGDFAGAIEVWQQALSLYGTAGNRQGEAFALLGMGVAYKSLGEPERAKEVQEQALFIFQELGDRTYVAITRGNLGDSYNALGEFDRAIAEYDAALPVFEESGDGSFQASTWLGLGVSYSGLGQYDRAISAYQTAADLYRSISDSAGETQSLTGISSAYFDYGVQLFSDDRPSEAMVQWERALELDRQLGDRDRESATLGVLGIGYYELRDFERAIEFLEASVLLSQELGKTDSELTALEFLGNAYRELGNRERAIEYDERRLNRLRELGNREAERTALIDLGNAEQRLGNLTAALAYEERSLALARELGDRRGEGSALNNLGETYVALGQYQKAIEYLEESLAIAEALNERTLEFSVLGNLGNAYGDLGEVDRAIEYHNRSLELMREVGERLPQINALANLGNVYFGLGDYGQSIAHYEESLALARELGDRRGEATALGNLGETYRALGDYNRAVDYQEQGLAISREVGDRGIEATILGSVGNTYLSAGNYNRAIEYYEQSLPLTREIGDRLGEGAMLGNVGLAYGDLGDYTRAIEYQEQSLAIAREIGNRDGENAALNSLGEAYRELGDYPRAIEYQEQSMEIARSIGDRFGEGASLNNMGLAHFSAGNLDAATTSLYGAIEVWESLRTNLNDANKVSIFEGQARTYRTLQKILVAQNRLEAALEVAERGRSRALVELLTGRVSNGTTIEPPTLADIQAIARSQNATLVEYSLITDDRGDASELYIWVVRPDGAIDFRRSSLHTDLEGDALESLVSRSREALGVRGRGIAVTARRDNTPTRDLQQLHQLLIEPIADLLPPNPDDRVIFIPQGELFLVPFPALQDGAGTYLIEKHTIQTAPSIQVLDLTRQAKERGNVTGDALIVGNPAMPEIALQWDATPQRLSPLPGAEGEAIEIAKILGTEPLLGDRATETAVVERMSRSRTIHLATHGLLDELVLHLETQGRSDARLEALNFPGALALTPSATDDGLLTTAEIAQLDLNAELVVLSACDTGRGELTGDGVVGLARSFVAAGASSIVVSLWQVPDAPTALLMTEFYRNLQENPDRARALRQAMLTIKATHPHPADWAAFTLIGETK